MLSIEQGMVVREDISDALGELANVLAGNLKRVLPGNLRLGLPETSGQMNGVKLRADQTCTQFTFEDAGVPFVVSIYEDDTEV